MGSSRSLPLAVLVASAVLGLVTGVAAVVVATGDDDARRDAATGRAVTPSRTRCAFCGHGTPRRSRAYARGDGAALADLYVAGSRTGAADRAVLRGYRERGLRVTGMRTQVLVGHRAARVRAPHRAAGHRRADRCRRGRRRRALAAAPRPALDPSRGAGQDRWPRGGSPRPTRWTDG